MYMVCGATLNYCRLVTTFVTYNLNNWNILNSIDSNYFALQTWIGWCDFYSLISFSYRFDNKKRSLSNLMYTMRFCHIS